MIFEYRFHCHEIPLGHKRIASKKQYGEADIVNVRPSPVLPGYANLICQEMLIFVVVVSCFFVSLVEPTYYLQLCEPKCASTCVCGITK